MKARIFNIQKFSLHDGPGIRTSVFFSGCNLSCRWCANPECRFSREEYTLEEVVEEVCRDKPFYDKSGGGVTLTGGEVLMQREFAGALCDRLRERGISVALETAGAVPGEEFRFLAEKADFIYLDCKHYDSARHRQGTGAGSAQCLANLRWLTGSGIPYRIRIPVIPGFNDSVLDAENFCRELQSRGAAHIELLPFHQLGEGKYEKNHISYEYSGVKPLKKEDLEEYYRVFEEKIPDTILK